MRSSLPSTSEEDELLLSGMASINDSGETGMFSKAYDMSQCKMN